MLIQYCNNPNIHDASSQLDSCFSILRSRGVAHLFHFCHCPLIKVKPPKSLPALCLHSVHTFPSVNDASPLCAAFPHSHLSHSSPLSFNSWLCTCCRSWNRRTSSRRPRRVATGAFSQKTTCCGGRSAGRKVSPERQTLMWSHLFLAEGMGGGRLNSEAVKPQGRLSRSLSPHLRAPGIDEPLPLKKRKITKPGFTHSPWKSAYIRQHRIDTNWRRGDLKSPKVAWFFIFSQV